MEDPWHNWHMPDEALGTEVAAEGVLMSQSCKRCYCVIVYGTDVLSCVTICFSLSLYQVTSWCCCW